MNTFTVFAQANPDGGAAVLGGALAIMVFFWIIGIALTIFWLWMLIDAVTNEPTTEQKILWFLVIFFLHFVGALIYLVVRKSGRVPSSPAV
jgi:hypothetical protein